MFNSQKALGIDICDDWIKMALVKKTGNGIHITKTAQCRIGQGYIINGKIEDAQGLAKKVKGLIKSKKMYAKYTAVSTIAEPKLVQIMDIPKEHSMNLSQFIRDEIKNYAVLPMNNILVDYCGLSSPSKDGSRRAMVTAMAGEQSGDFVRSLCSSGMNLDSFEPGTAAYIRSCYSKKIAKKFDRNLLFTIIRGEELIFCLFRNQVLEFVQTKQIDKEILESDNCCKWLAEEINAVVNFYETEYPQNSDQWEVTLVSSLFEGPENRNANALSVFADGVKIDIVSTDQTCLDTPVVNCNDHSQASGVAVGLAMRHLDCCESPLSLNLLPPQAQEIKAAKKQALVAFNIAAMILLAFILSIAFLNSKEMKYKEKLEVGKKKLLELDTTKLTIEQKSLKEKIESLSQGIEKIEEVTASGRFFQWADILRSISLSVPKKVRITELSCKGGEITIEGIAVSYESINFFVNMLNEQKGLGQAVATGTRKDNQFEGMVSYNIKCSLAQDKRIASNVNR